MSLARLIPGARAPMIITLGLTNATRRAFLVGDLIGCGLWAALYTTIGTIGSHITGNPVLAVAGAAAAAALIGIIGQRIHTNRTYPQEAPNQQAPTEHTPNHQSADALHNEQH
ncbi:hypothetical protein GCM10027613_51520 [Microlunatus endophyticus]